MDDEMNNENETRITVKQIMGYVERHKTTMN